MGAGQSQRLRTVVGKVLPLALIQRAWQLRQVGPDDVLCAICGAGVLDHPVGDDRQDRIEAPAYDRGLVFHDHAQANGGFGFWHGRARRIGPRVLQLNIL